MKNKRLAMALGIALGATMHIPRRLPDTHEDYFPRTRSNDKPVVVNNQVRYGRKPNRAQRRAK